MRFSHFVNSLPITVNQFPIGQTALYCIMHVSNCVVMFKGYSEMYDLGLVPGGSEEVGERKTRHKEHSYQ